MGIQKDHHQNLAQLTQEYNLESFASVMNWMISGLRWLSCCLPKKLISDGAMTHARGRVGLTVFQVIFNKLTDSFKTLKPDFNQWITVIFDGTTATMPDTTY